MKAQIHKPKRWIHLVFLLMLFILSGCGLLESEEGDGGGRDGDGQDQTLVVEE